MRLRRKLLLVHLFVAAAATLAFGQLHLSARRVAEEYRQVAEQILPQVRALEEIRAATAKILGITNELALVAAFGASLDPERRREIEAQETEALRNAQAGHAAALQAYADRATRRLADEQRFVLGLQSSTREMLAASGEFLIWAEHSTTASLLKARERLKSAEGELDGVVGAALEREAGELALHAARTEAAMAASGRLAWLAAALVLLLLLGAGQVVARAVVRPIGRLTEATARIAAGQPVTVESHGARDEVGRLIEAFGKMTQDLATSQTRARHLALHDALTDLPNRALFAERLAQALLHARRYGSAAAVLCLDLDRFKEVNDTLGHGAGDLLLQEVAGRLRVCARESDTVARLGGDEFAVVQVGAAQPAGAEALCRRLCEALTEPYLLDGHEIVVGTSIGVALAPVDGDEPSALLKHADIALYRAKSDGRGTFRFFEEGMNLQLLARRTLERDLRGAVAEGQFELRYQPQVELSTGRVVGTEALLRWRHPERGEVQPAGFIPLAEETGLIVPIGAWVLREACAQARAWPGLRMAVNLSPAQFRQPGLIDAVGQALRESGLEPGRLELEITESVLLEDTAAAIASLHALKALGVRIAMDDFGTGYSSLSYLRRFPFDKIKIDRSFVADLRRGERTDAAAIVRAMVSLSSSLGMTATAEGIEDEAQAAFLRAEGCDEVQGYHYGRPMPAADLTRLLEHRRDAAEVGPSVRPARPADSGCIERGALLPA